MMGDSIPTSSNKASAIRKPMKSSVLQLLASRQEWGRSNRIGSFSNVETYQQRLSSSIPWNSSRVRNMIMAVGPTTPASVLMGEEDEEDRHLFDFSDDSDSPSDDDENEYQIDNAEDDENGENRDQEYNLEHDMVESVDDSSEDEQEDEDELRRQRHLMYRQTRHASRMIRRDRGLLYTLRRRIQEAGPDSSDDNSEIMFQAARHDRSLNSDRQTQAWLPSMRHEGCVNTACWLDAPWRLSNMSSSLSSTTQSSIDSIETPTQIMTSGDDCVVKVWDVRNAMGMTSPEPGGWDTACPFGYSKQEPRTHSFTNNLNQTSCRRDGSPVYGSVQLLTTLATGHEGNVFHVTPIQDQPGKILTCAADGYLRMSDVQSQTSSVVVTPFADEVVDDNVGFHGIISGGMAFSHSMLTSNTGLLCSDRGLHHFDIRLPPRQQEHHSLLKVPSDILGLHGSPTNACRVCVVWPPGGTQTESSTLVFAGRSNATVELIDLRMNGAKNTTLQRFRPRHFEGNGDTSVSGLDLSKDGRELLVSYESDQIYSFPIFSDSKSPGRPTLNEMTVARDRFSETRSEYVAELISYGGHLNRLTFLKNARYAGPNDDYIVTGSDSGNAWIYERKTGTVASLLSADNSTCNGCVPHPSLPFFITYGIDTNAKLWRAAPCVDINVDDSCFGRSKASLHEPYTISPVVSNWEKVQAIVKRCSRENGILPDFVASSNNFDKAISRKIGMKGSVCFGNSLRRLPDLLTHNRYECYVAYNLSQSCPVEQPLERFCQMITLSRLRFQAESLGLHWKLDSPWVFEAPKNLIIHPSDIVPNHPSDWIPFDSRMSKSPIDIYMHCNTEDYESALFPKWNDNCQAKSIPWLTVEQQSIGGTADEVGVCGSKCKGGNIEFEQLSRKILFETASTLKDGGNQAMKEELFSAAARRYDKAIQYCAVAFIERHDKGASTKHLTEGHRRDIPEEFEPCPDITVWSPLLRVMISSRLNLALLFAKSFFGLPACAAAQARAALKQLLPFVRKQGHIVLLLKEKKGSEKKEHFLFSHEPASTFQEAKNLEAKAYFRIGSAEYDLGDYASAVKNLKLSLKASSSVAPTKKPDSIVVRRLHEAKRKRKTEKKANGRKFQRHYMQNECP